MTNQISSKNNQSTIQTVSKMVEQDKIEAFFNQPNNSKLVVLNLNDLNADILNHLKAKQCTMLLLNENFDIVEDVKTKQIQYIQLKINGCTQLVSVKNIIRFEACGNYTNIHLINKAKPVLTSRTLKYYAERLDETTFLRPHQSHLINNAFIDKVILKPTAHLVLKDGKQISIARRKLKMFLS